MKINRPFLRLLLLTCFLTKPAYSQEELSKFDRWIGHWAVKIDGTTIHETWKKNPDGSYSGASWSVKANGDSVFSESIRVHMLNDNIYYEPFLKDKPGSKPVSFRLIISSSNEWMFSNPDNDFPKYILYKWLDEKHLRASIGNSDNDTEHPMVFEYERR